MSSPGITAINSGPLIIRTYLNSSINNTYVTKEFDVPVPSNQLLITSTGGCLVPTDNLVISSINVSSLQASTILVSSLLASSISTGFISSLGGNISSLLVSSFYANSINFSTVITSTIGIGTSAPQTALDMVGTANISSVTSTTTYDTPGTYPIELPPGVKSIEFEMIGAGGLGDTFPLGNGGGTGGYMKGIIELPSNLTYLNVVVGAAGVGGAPSGASYINVGSSPGTPSALLAIAGAGGSGKVLNEGGGGGGGNNVASFATGAAPGSDGVGSGNGEGGSISGPTNGGVAGTYCSGSPAGNAGANRVPGNYGEALGGAGVAGNLYAGGSGYAGGGSGCGGGGGSSYYDVTYTTLIDSLSGSGVDSSLLPILTGFGRSGQGGKIILTVHYAALNTNGDIVARNICASYVNTPVMSHTIVSTSISSIVYNTPGSYLVTVPIGTTSINYEIIGAGGRQPFINYSAGTGGYLTGHITLPTSVSTLNVVVGSLGITEFNPSGASYINGPNPTPAYLFVVAGAGGNSNAGDANNGGGGGGGIANAGVYPGENGSPGLVTPCSTRQNVEVNGKGGSTVNPTQGGAAGRFCNGAVATSGTQPGFPYPGTFIAASGGQGACNFFGTNCTVAGGGGYAGGGAGCSGGGGSSYANPTYTAVYAALSGSTVPSSILPGYGRPNQGGYVALQFNIGTPTSIITNGDVTCRNMRCNTSITSTIVTGSIVVQDSVLTDYVSTNRIRMGTETNSNYAIEITNNKFHTMTPGTTYNVNPYGYIYGTWYAKCGNNLTILDGVQDFNTTIGNAEDIPWINCCIKTVGSGGMWADSVILTSDERIKTNIQPVIENEARDVLRQLKSVTYQYIDRVHNHPLKEYGFIAQEVKPVLPYAISIQTEFIPNIYDLGDFNVLDENATMITLHQKTLEHVKIGDIIKLFDLQHKQIICTVVDVNYNYMVVDKDLSKIASSYVLTEEDMKNKVTEHTVFVHGTKVTDLHTLNKDAIYSVGIAALQDIDRTVTQQQSTIVSHQSTLIGQEQRIKVLEDKLELLLLKR